MPEAPQGTIILRYVPIPPCCSQKQEQLWNVEKAAFGYLAVGLRSCFGLLCCCLLPCFWFALLLPVALLLVCSAVACCLLPVALLLVCSAVACCLLPVACCLPAGLCPVFLLFG